MYRALTARLGVREERVARYLIGALVVGFACLLAAIGAALWVTSENQRHTYWVNHTYQVGVAIGQARIFTEQAEAIRRGYLLTGNGKALTAFREANDKLDEALDDVTQLIKDNPVQEANLARVRQALAGLRARQAATIDRALSGDGSGALAAFTTEYSVERMSALREMFDGMYDLEQSYLLDRDAEQKASVGTFYTILAVTGILLLLVIAVTTITLLRFTRDLTRSRDDLRQLNEGLEELVDARTADLSRANEEIQRFAYIVSHDLRSPLVNVMGFTAELEAAVVALRDLIDRAEERAPDIVTNDAAMAAREDLPEAIGFIRTSTQKMDRLINAILKLSREGRRVIAPEPIDMDVLVKNAADAIRHRFDDRGAVFHQTPLPPIVSDRLAIEQIIGNLIENAVKYLQPGRPGRIEVSGRREGARTIYEVTDNGRGVDPRDHQRIFDLFRRSGPQDQPGEGIGLAHVRALAYRLGGVIDVSSTLGEGSTFRLSLPTIFEQQEPKA